MTCLDVAHSHSAELAEGVVSYPSAQTLRQQLPAVGHQRLAGAALIAETHGSAHLHMKLF